MEQVAGAGIASPKHMSKFSFDLVDETMARSFWDDSPYANVFTHPHVLSRCGGAVDWWMAWKRNRPICLWPVCRPDGITVGLPGFFYYVGPMWSQSSHEIPVHSRMPDSTSVYEGFIVRLLERYGTIHAQLPLGLDDVRMFDWWNYHEPEKPRFSIQPCYTACIRGLQSLTSEGIQAAFRRVRQQELRQARAWLSLERAVDWTSEDLTNLYGEVMGLQNIAVTSATKNQVATLVGLVTEGMGEVVAFRDAESGQLTSAMILLYAKGVANAVLGMTARQFRRGGRVEAWTIYHAILAARDSGADVFDFNGANSPARGDNKHSYGAAAELFFEIRYPG